MEPTSNDFLAGVSDRGKAKLDWSHKKCCFRSQCSCLIYYGSLIFSIPQFFTCLSRHCASPFCLMSRFFTWSGSCQNIPSLQKCHAIVFFFQTDCHSLWSCCHMLPRISIGYSPESRLHTKGVCKRKHHHCGKIKGHSSGGDEFEWLKNGNYE